MVLAIQRQPGTNTIDVVDAVKALLPQFKAIVPPSIYLKPLYDRSAAIRDSVNDVKFTLFLAIILVVLVIFLFLRNLSATLIPSIALPMAIVGTFAVMYELNYTIDNLSLMALTLSVGFVVDDAIVMLENIVRHMELGEGVMEAALSGSKEIGFTILSMTMALVAVFIPVLFMGGVIGRLLHEFAVVIMAAILVSGVVSLTLTPMLCSRFLRPPGEEKHGRMYMFMERFFARLLHTYDISLQWTLRHRRTVMTGAAVIFVVTVWQFIVIPKGFLPDVDSSQLRLSTEAIQGISFEAMLAHQDEIGKIIYKDPNVQDYFGGVGGPAGSTINSGNFFLRLKDPPDRPKIPSETMIRLQDKYGSVPVLGSALRASAHLFARHPDVNDVMDELRIKFAAVPGINVFMQNPPPIQLGGRQSKSLYQFTLQSPDTAELYREATKFQDKMGQLPGITDVTTDMLIANPQVNVNIDRDKAAALGVNAGTSGERPLYSAYGQRQISTIYTPNDEYWVILQLQDQYQRDPTALALLYIRSSTGSLVPLQRHRHPLD